MPHRSCKIVSLAVTLHAAGTADLTAPADATGGASIAGWKTRGAPLRYAEIAIDAAGACNVAAGAALVGWDGTTWRRLATLNGGSQINLTATLGFAEVVEDAGLYDRLAIAGTLSAESVEVTATPLEVTE